MTLGVVMRQPSAELADVMGRAGAFPSGQVMIPVAGEDKPAQSWFLPKGAGLPVLFLMLNNPRNVNGLVNELHRLADHGQFLGEENHLLLEGRGRIPVLTVVMYSQGIDLRVYSRDVEIVDVDELYELRSLATVFPWWQPTPSHGTGLLSENLPPQDESDGEEDDAPVRQPFRGLGIADQDLSKEFGFTIPSKSGHKPATIFDDEEEEGDDEEGASVLGDEEIDGPEDGVDLDEEEDDA